MTRHPLDGGGEVVAGRAPVETSDDASSASPTATPLTPDEVEAAERLAAETAYINFWRTVWTFAEEYPQDQWAQVVEEIAVNPVLSQILSGRAEQVQKGIALYGEVITRVSWTQPISGQASATLMDCQDSSNAGQLEVATGDKLTGGLPRSLVRGTLVKGADGAWRVQQIEYLVDEVC